ncbi:MAG: hypothetical protein DYG98_19305 [Haliscomenobacteraceae bacterium CHB4]|nr:hypothetical protein [Saprospiraceae bacterium]MCE7925208.1 hypothetical protein [Haliscomenobacteraceae bacterium CHB4]
MSLKIKTFAFIICLIAGTAAQAQHKNKKTATLSPEALERLHTGEDTLALLAYAVVNDSIEQERFAACRVLIQTLVRTLKVENSFQYRFDRLKSISILAPPDSSFRIFTWQLFVNDSTYRYYGAIQMNSPELKLFPLIDRSDELDDRPVYEALPPERWYGALYYTLRQFDTKEGRKYLLCGYDAYSFFEKRKVIEVLGFDTAGKPVFGAPVFDKPGAKTEELRMIFEYSAEASVRVNWDEQYQLILFDHLIPWPSPFGRGISQVPDGSYDGLRFEKGRWKFIDKVFNDVQEEAPRPEPVLDARQDKDIMGKDKKRKKGR